MLVITAIESIVVILGCSWLHSLQTFIPEMLEATSYPQKKILFCLNLTRLVSVVCHLASRKHGSGPLLPALIVLCVH